MLVVKDVIVIILWVSSIISGVPCCNYDWGMYVGPQSVSHMNLCDKQLQDAPMSEGRLSPLSGTLAVSPRPAGTDETNQNSFAESSIFFCLILTPISLVIRAILLAGNTLLWVQLRAMLKI